VALQRERHALGQRDLAGRHLRAVCVHVCRFFLSP
jgi:hypothetical protein